MAGRYIDATKLIAGRLASYAAKQALLGDKVTIVNAENAIITGRKETFLKRFKEKKGMGQPTKGPFFPRTADRMLRRMIRGMLPHHQPKGKAAYQKVMCYLGIPEGIMDKKFESLTNAQLSQSKTVKFTSLGELSRLIK